MGKDLILSSTNISRGSLQEPVWDIDSRVPSGKLKIKKINYENHPNTDWVLMDHIPPQSGSTTWFARTDDLGFSGVTQTAIGVESDLANRFRRAGTFESNCPGYNEIKLQTVDTNFEGTTDRAYWVFSKETRDVFGRNPSGNGTLTVGGESAFSFNKLPLIDSWDFTSSNEAKAFYVDPNASGTGSAGPLIVTHQHTGGNKQVIYIEAGGSGTANSNSSIGNLLHYGIQIWIRRYIPIYNPYAIIHQTGADIRRDYLTGDSKTSPPIKFMYLQLFVPVSGSHSMDILEVRLLDTALFNVLQNNLILVPTDDTNSLAIETNPSASGIKSGDTLADIIDNSILSNARVGNTADNIDEIIQFKLNREYMFDEFNRLEIYFADEQGPFQIRFLNANYELVHTQTLYTTTPDFTADNNSLIILKMLGPNSLSGFTNSVSDNVNSYVISWADESSLADNHIYRKVEQVDFDLGIGGAKELIKGPSKSLSLAMLKGPESDFSSWFHTAHIHRSANNNDADFVWSSGNNATTTTNWFEPDNEMTFRISEGSPTTTPNKWIKSVVGTPYEDWNEIMIVAGENTGGQNWYWKFRRDARISKAGGGTQIGQKLAIPPTGNKTGQKWEPFDWFDNNLETANNGRIFLDNVRTFLMFTWQSDIDNTGNEYTPSLLFSEGDNNFNSNYTNATNNFALALYYEVNAGWYGSLFALKGGDPANNYRLDSSNPDLRFSGLISLDYYVRNNKEAVKGSYEPDKSIKPVNWENTGEVAFQLQKINQRGLIDEDETPKSYSIECHICDCK